MMNEDYQRGGEEFYDNQEGGTRTFLDTIGLGPKKTPTDRAIATETTQLPVTRLPGFREIRQTRFGLSALPIQEDSIPMKVTPPRRPSADMIKGKTIKEILDEIQLPSSIHNLTWRRDFEGKFVTRLESLLKHLLLKHDKLANTYIALDLEKVKLIKLLCDMSQFDTK